MSIAAEQGTRLERNVPWGALRLPVVVLGGLLVLQSSQQLDAPKLAYLVIAGLAFAGSAYSVFAGSARALALRYRYLLAADIALLGLIAASFLVARLQETPTTAWVRDAAAYALFAAVPILAFDAASLTSRRLISGLLVITGLLASLSWAIEWMQRRGIVDLPLDRLLLPAGLLAVALYAFALAAAIRKSSAPYLWSVAAGIVLGLFLVTGTRSSLVLLVVPAAMAMVARPRDVRHTATVVGVHLVAAVTVLGVVQLGLGDATRDTSRVTPPEEGIGAITPSAQDETPIERLESIESLAADPVADPSVRERVAQYAAAWELFLTSPVVGVGPGHPIEWTDVSGLPRDEFTADTPLVLPAKFGVVGTVTMLFLALAYLRLSVHLGGSSRWSPGALALIGFEVFAIVSLPLGFPVEDKSFSFGLVILLALALLLPGRSPHAGRPNCAAP